MKFISLVALISCPPFLAFSSEVGVQNGSFEQELKGWKADPGAEIVTKILPSAAMLGSKGLRLESDKARTFALTSEPVTVTPGKSYTVSFWAGLGGKETNGGGTVDVKMIFRGADGSELKPAMAKIRKWPGTNVSGKKFADNSILAAAAPEGATQLEVRISSAGKAPFGPVDIDDFKIEELSDEVAPPVPPGGAHPVPPSDPEHLKELEAEITANPYRGRKPPKIVLKLDDFVPASGGVHPKWSKVAEFARKKNIKVTFGIIAGKMESDCPAFVQWTKAEHDAGRIEFWCHGWDHAERKEGEKRIMEFGGESYEYQKQHLQEANRLAREKLGFDFVSFGAPFNGIDENTAKALSELPEYRVWMYGDPKKPAGKTVLERSYAVSIESPTMIPNFGAFLDGYAHNRGAELFVMQGHPAAWNDERWEQFVKIVEFLETQHAEFVFASDLAPKSPNTRN